MLEGIGNLALEANVILISTRIFHADCDDGDVKTDEAPPAVGRPWGRLPLDIDLAALKRRDERERASQC